MRIAHEVFGLQLVDHYTDGITNWAERLRNDATMSPLSKLRRFFDWTFTALERNDFKGGCPIGNLSMEMADVSESFRQRLEAAFGAIKKGILTLLEEAQNHREIPDSLDATQVTDFIVAGWQGALLQAKVTKSTAPREAFEHMVFDRLLKEESPGNFRQEAHNSE